MTRATASRASPCTARSEAARAERARCDDHHEMLDLGAAGELVHRSGDSVAPVWPHSDGWSALAYSPPMGGTVRSGTWRLKCAPQRLPPILVSSRTRTSTSWKALQRAPIA